MSQTEGYNEQELAGLVCKKNPQAMKQLYSRNVGYLTAVCSRYVNDKDLRDVLHDSFIRIYSSIKSFDYRGDGSLRRWMTRITVNESLKHLQKSRHLNFIQYDEELPDIACEESADDNITTDAIPIAYIQDMIRKMPDGYRTVFSMYALDGFCHKEIAAVLGISESTSASQYHRARKMLAQMITEYNRQLL